MNPKRNRIMSLVSLSLLLVLVIIVMLIRFYPSPSNFTDYPKVTHTRSGVEGDPINLVFVGSHDQIMHSFQQAGWLIPDPITPQTSAKIAVESLAHKSYPTAPVSLLYVFGRVQDFAFEKPTNDVQNRGHIRLWKTGDLIGRQPVWVGAASYDSGIELSGTNHLPTHHIAPAVDLERDAVGSDLQKTGLVTEEVDAAFTAPIVFARNGGGDYYESDGQVLVINYTHASIQLTPPAVLSDGLKTAVFHFYDALLTMLLLAVIMSILALALLVMGLWPGLRWLLEKLGPRVRMWWETRRAQWK